MTDLDLPRAGNLDGAAMMRTVRRAGLYVRISDDRAGDRLGVLRQRADCEALCARRDWLAVQVYEDDDVSAYSGKRRPGYERLLADLRAGVIDAVVCWHPDRLHRSPRELEEFITVVEQTRAEVATVTAGDIDLSTPTGRMHARIVGAVARHESEHKAERIRRKVEELAMAGAVGGGGTRPFGYREDRVTLHPAEAELVREAARRVLAGEGIGTVLADWSRRGIPTVTGKPWRTTSLRRLLLSPRIAGLRQHRGEAVGPAVWPGVISEADHRRLVRLLSDPARRKGGRPREYLLTGGLARCGPCGAALVARPRADGARCYVCATGVNFSGCGKIRRLADPVEALVRDAVLHRLASPAVAKALAAHDRRGADDDALATMHEVEETLRELDADYYEHHRMSRARYLDLSERLTAQAQAAMDALAARQGSAVLKGLPATAEALREQWEAGTHAWRRSLVSAAALRIVFRPAVKGRNVFDPTAIDPVWRA